MREPPRLSDSAIRAALDQRYGLSVAALSFLPIGNDLASFVYRVDTADGTGYFLKVRAGAGFSLPSLAVPRMLYEQGIPHILTPLTTAAGELWTSLDDYALSLYPWLDARTAASAGLTDQHWRGLGSALRRIHTSQLPAELHQTMRHETFTPSRRRLLTDLEALLADNPALEDASQRELSRFWRTRHDQVRAVIDRADALGAQLRQAALPLALCHADLHTWNLLLDTTQQLWIVDWDETVLAPKERDLMFVIGGIGAGLVSAHQTSCFLQGYGTAEIDRRALVYYRYAWAVQDMAAAVEEIFFSPERSAQSRSDAVAALIDLFAPGNIVAIARESDSATL